MDVAPPRPFRVAARTDEYAVFENDPAFGRWRRTRRNSREERRED